MSNNTTQKKSAMDVFLNGIEKVCNKLPSPPFIFMFLFALVGVLSFVVSATGASVINPSNGEVVQAQNFLSVAGLHWFLDNMVKNFTGFAPLGLVIAMTLGIGLCEESGLVMGLLRAGLSDVPPAIVPYLIAFIGTIGKPGIEAGIIGRRYRSAGSWYPLPRSRQKPDRWYDLWLRWCERWFHS